jgi:hypothetical protein
MLAYRTLNCSSSSAFPDKGTFASGALWPDNSFQFTKGRGRLSTTDLYTELPRFHRNTMDCSEKVYNCTALMALEGLLHRKHHEEFSSGRDQQEETRNSNSITCNILS